MKRKHIKNYTAVRKAMREYFERAYRSAKEDLARVKETFGNKDRWDDAEKCYRYPDGGVCSNGDLERAERYAGVTLPGIIKHWEERLENADRAGKMIEISIDIRWGRQSIGTGCPHVDAWLVHEDERYGSASVHGTGTARGCGYDLRSSAMQDALSFKDRRRDVITSREERAKARASLDRFVIEHGEPLWREYAIARIPFPHLDIDGKGSSVFTRLFRHVGCKPFADNPVKDYLIDYRETDRGDDFYHVIRKDRI